MPRRGQRKHCIKATIYDRKGRVLAYGMNSYVKTHPIQKKLSDDYGNGEQIFLHAEIDAIIRLGSMKRKAYRILVERYDRNGNPKNAKPCILCENFIKSVGIKMIEHTVG